MSQVAKARVYQDTVTVLMISAVLITGVVMLFISALQGSSFLAVVGISVAFWSILLLFFTPTKREFLALLKASANAGGSNIERSLIELDSAEKGVYLPPQNLRDFKSSSVFVPKTVHTTLPASDEINDKLFTEKKNGLLLTPPGLALSIMFEQELGLSFRKITLPQMQMMITKLIRNQNFAEDARIQIQDNTITLEVIGGIFTMLCQESRNSQPRTHEQVGCMLASAFACAFAKASDKPVTIQKDTLNTDDKTLIIEYRLEEV